MMATEGFRNAASMPMRHPRRTLPHESVSLRRGPAQPNSSSKRGVTTCDSQSPSDTSSLLRPKLSSGETSNAEHWFENCNENVAKQQSSFADDDPPFYHEHSPSHPYAQLSLPLRPSFVHAPDSGSSSEEYRSVIDDLTIENKKLKRRLKKYEGSHKTQLDSDKLFEVKIHGLPADKKRELKETLRRFAQGLNQAPNTAANATSSDQSMSRVSALKAHSTLSSTRVADSGYGSLTASRKASTTHSGNGNSTGNGGDAQERLEASRIRDRSIQSYLSDIPAGLMPRQPTAMTEKSKKKLVVRRLESIFGGRNAVPGAHQQPLQQQEVSHSAAQADKSALEAEGQHSAGEGTREALIMNTETEDPMDFVQGTNLDRDLLQGKCLSDEDSIEHHDFAYDDSEPVEQRPTRPLDLDPYRAQVPAENVQYIRHLGFVVADADVKRETMDDDGWIYLNVLINMAQLHTLNVTPDFVRRAVSDNSSKLELSRDTRKIRWRGPRDSQTSSSLSSEGTPNSQNPTPNESRKRPRAVLLDPNESAHNTEPSAKKGSVTYATEDKFTYRPLFPRKDDEDSDSGSSSVSSDSASTAPEQTGESTGFTSTIKLMRSSTLNKRRDDGPIIFYNHALFCTDLSGDASKSYRSPKTIDYQTFTSSPLGAPSRHAPSITGSVRPSRRPLMNTEIQDAADDDSVMSSEAELEMPGASPKRVTFAEPEEPFSFEVSGIGGIYPEDNLAITVLRQHTVDPTASPPRVLYAPKLQHVLPPRPRSCRSRETLLSTRFIRFKPSALPPPSYALNGEDSESEHDSDAMSVEAQSDDDENTTTQRTVGRPPSTYVGRVSKMALSACGDSSPNGSSEEESEDDDSTASDAADDGTVDFLAAARKVDPETIRVMERQYDAEVADRLAEEIPAGSSAATAGGGSGFNSPVDWRTDVAMAMQEEEVGEERSIMS